MSYFNLIMTVVFLSSCAHREKISDHTKPQTIDLKASARPSMTHELVYDEVVMTKSNFSVYQKHKGLKKLFSIQDDESRLCGPAAIAIALITEKQNNTKAKHLALDGFNSQDLTLDANQVVEQLTACSNTRHDFGTSVDNEALCLKKIYLKSQLRADVRVIGLHSNLEKLPDIHTELRRPTVNDIIYLIKNGYQVVATIESLSQENEEFVIKNGHAVVINGFARNTNWPKDMLYAFINDPNEYSNGQSTYPFFDQALISKMRETSMLPKTAGDLSIEGKIHYGLSQRAVVSILLAFKTL
jgi:hypothetical protein